MGGIKIDVADQLFSKWVRNRDNWTCNRCKKVKEKGNASLHNSHYWGRGKESTRFEPDNCDALCYGCHHIWEKDEREEYREFKINQLGQKRFDSLRLQAHQYHKKDRAMERIRWRLALKDQSA